MTGWYRRQFGISCPLEQSCPLFQDLAVCRMSFAQRLANKARATRNILRDEWIEETLEEFMEECQEAAEDGKYEHKMRTDVPSLADEEATDEAIELVNKKLPNLASRRLVRMARAMKWRFGQNGTCQPKHLASPRPKALPRASKAIAPFASRIGTLWLSRLVATRCASTVIHPPNLASAPCVARS